MTAVREHLDDLAAYVERMEASQETHLRLLMNPVYSRRIPDGGFYRFVRESNGHPGHCAEGCFHYSVDAALAHFEGRDE